MSNTNRTAEEQREFDEQARNQICQAQIDFQRQMMDMLVAAACDSNDKSMRIYDIEHNSPPWPSISTPNRIYAKHHTPPWIHSTPVKKPEPTPQTFPPIQKDMVVVWPDEHRRTGTLVRILANEERLDRYYNRLYYRYTVKSCDTEGRVFGPVLSMNHEEFQFVGDIYPARSNQTRAEYRKTPEYLHTLVDAIDQQISDLEDKKDKLRAQIKAAKSY